MFLSGTEDEETGVSGRLITQTLIAGLVQLERAPRIHGTDEVTNVARPVDRLATLGQAAQTPDGRGVGPARRRAGSS